MKTILKTDLSKVPSEPTGFTRHFGEDFLNPRIRKLEIAEDKGSDEIGFYLLYFDENCEELTDTYHDTLDDALKQAKLEFSISREHWTEVDG